MDSMNTFPDFIKTCIRLSFANNEYNNYKKLNAAANISFFRSMLLCTEAEQIDNSEKNPVTVDNKWTMFIGCPWKCGGVLASGVCWNKKT